MKRQVYPGFIADGQQALSQYQQVLQQLEELSPVTMRNYLSDLRQFTFWGEAY